MSLKDRIIELLVDTSCNYQEIGDYLGTSRQRIHQVAKESGLERGHSGSPRQYETSDILSLWKEGLMVKEIADTLSCS